MASKKLCTRRICMVWTRVLVRLIQFCTSLAAYIALRTVGVTYQSTAQGENVSVIVTSGAFSFARIINFLVFVYAFAFLIFIEWLHLCVYPVNYCEKLMDIVALICLGVASLVLLLSKLTLRCRSGFGQFVRCGQLYFAVAMSLLSTLAFLTIILIGKREDRERRNDENQQQSDGHNGDQASDAYNRSATPVPIVTAEPAP